MVNSLGKNGYGDEGALLVARCLSDLEELDVSGNKMGEEGAVAVATINQLRWLGIGSNVEVTHGAFSLGRLPCLRKLYAST